MEVIYVCVGHAAFERAKSTSLFTQSWPLLWIHWFSLPSMALILLSNKIIAQKLLPGPSFQRKPQDNVQVEKWQVSSLSDLEFGRMIWGSNLILRVVNRKHSQSCDWMNTHTKNKQRSICQESRRAKGFNATKSRDHLFCFLLFLVFRKVYGGPSTVA